MSGPAQELLGPVSEVHVSSATGILFSSDPSLKEPSMVASDVVCSQD